MNAQLCAIAMSSACLARESHTREEHDLGCMVQGMATSFTMFLGGIVLNALTSSVVTNLPFAIMSDILPPEQLR